MLSLKLKVDMNYKKQILLLSVVLHNWVLVTLIKGQTVLNINSKVNKNLLTFWFVLGVETDNSERVRHL